MEINLARQDLNRPLYGGHNLVIGNPGSPLLQRYLVNLVPLVVPVDVLEAIVISQVEEAPTHNVVLQPKEKLVARPVFNPSQARLMLLGQLRRLPTLGLVLNS